MSGLGLGPLGLMPLGGDYAPPPPRGRVYASVLPHRGTATLAGSQAARATLAVGAQGFAKLAASAGSSTLQTD